MGDFSSLCIFLLSRVKFEGKIDDQEQETDDIHDAKDGRVQNRVTWRSRQDIRNALENMRSQSHYMVKTIRKQLGVYRIKSRRDAWLARCIPAERQCRRKGLYILLRRTSLKTEVTVSEWNVHETDPRRCVT
jgi:hypothetical protein